MAQDYSRRRKGSSESDGFDWDAFDKETSELENASGEVPQRRRRASAGSSNRSTRGLATQRGSQGKGSDRGSAAARKPKKKRVKKQLTDKQKAFRKRMRIIVLSIFLIMVVVVSGMFVGMYAAVSREIKEMNFETLANGKTSIIYYYDANGKEQEYEKLQSDVNSIWIESDKISPSFKNAIVSIEDERFYTHKGVDVKRTLGATASYILSKVGIGSSNYGGSTITQQVIKNITQEDEFRATRKIKEMMRAIALEKELSKDEILTLYCNVVYFANNCTGVEAASQKYFGKTAAELNVQEAASIAGITQYPAEYDPIAHPDKNTEKRNTVLSKMKQLGKITEAEYEVAVASPLQLSKAGGANQNAVTSYFTDQVVNDIIKDLVAKGWKDEYATRQVFNGGYKIYATVDPTVQGIMQDVFEDKSDFPSGSKAQAAMVITDPYTGAVKGLVGGLGEKTDIRGWNRATQAIRQPGSSIKPLSVYGPAIDLGKITEISTVMDEEITVGSDNWKPKNSYKGFKGEMTIKEAVARSANIPAVSILNDDVGITNSYGYLQNKFHINTIQDSDKNLSSLALGGLTQGVTVEEMAAAYNVFVNSGKYTAPYTYTKITDGSDNMILENKPATSQAMSEAAAYITADLLSGPVNLSYGTATNAELDTGVDAYGKTGTTDENFDKWFVGFTADYVGAVWFGFDTPSSLSDAGISGNPCVSAWKSVFDKLSKNVAHQAINRPASVKEIDICEDTGKIANEDCDSYKAYFVDGTQPKEECDGRSSYSSNKNSSGSSSSSSSGGASSSSSSSGKNSGSSSSSGGSSSSGSTGGTSSSSSSSGKNSGSSSSSGGSSSSGSSSSGSSSSGSSSSGSSSGGSSSSGSSSGGSSSSGSSSSGSSSGGSSSSGSSSSGSSSGGSSSSGSSSGGSSSGGSSSSGSSSSGSSGGESSSSGSGGVDAMVAE